MMHTSKDSIMKLDQVSIRMIEAPPLYSSEPIRNVESAIRVLDRMLKNYDREVFGVINLRNDGRPINFNIISMGTLDASLVHPREVFKSAILSNAQSMIAFHNHPSGVVKPSELDIEVTDRLKQAADILGIRLDDHIILGDGSYFSFLEQKQMKIDPPKYARTIDDLNLSAAAVAEPGTAMSVQEMSEKIESQIIPRRRPAQTVEDIMEKLENGLADLFSSETYKTYLNTMSKFHNYSLNNTLLIAMQKPDAQLVAGFNAWKKNFGRHVKKGEKGIRILQPAPYKVRYEQEKKDPDTGKVITGMDGNPVKEIVEIEKPGFRVASVFDISQTEGKELPTLGIEELTGEVRQYDRFMEALAKTCPVAIKYENIQGGAKGYYNLSEDYIALQKDMGQMQTVKTLIHEMSHQRLHSIEAVKQSGEKKNSQTREVEAESVAYAVCQHYGIDTSEYSFGYIAGWAGSMEMDVVKRSLQTIRDTASGMINEIDGYFLERDQVKEKEISADQPKRESVLAGLNLAKEEVKALNANRTVPVRSSGMER